MVIGPVHCGSSSILKVLLLGGHPVVWYGGTTLKDISSDPTESWTKGHKVVWVVGKP